MYIRDPGLIHLCDGEHCGGAATLTYTIDVILTLPWKMTVSGREVASTDTARGRA